MSRFFQREFIPVDRPTTIRVRPLLPADQMPDEHATFENIAAILQDGAREIARNLGPGQIVTRNNLLQNANGFLQMTNIENNNHAHIEGVRIENLDIFTLYDLFDRAHAESNPDLSVYTVYWDFWVNPQSVLLGGARLAAQKDGTCKIANKLYEFNQIRAGCAAVCCAIHLIKTLPEHQSINNQINRPSSHRKIYDLALTIQNELRKPFTITNNRMVSRNPSYSIG